MFVSYDILCNDWEQFVDKELFSKYKHLSQCNIIMDK